MPSLLDRLLTISDLFERDMERAFAGTGLTRARVAVLWVLQLDGPSTQQRIAERIGVSARNVSALVDALQARGYVARTPHPDDRRAVHVALTPSAVATMTTMQRDHAELAASLLDAVAPPDRAALERGIDAITARLATLVAQADR